MMMRMFVAALAIMGASAFQPGAVGSQLSGSRVAGSRPQFAAQMPLATQQAALRSGAVSMNSEYETVYEMFDPIYVGLTITIFTVLLLKTGGLF